MNHVSRTAVAILREHQFAKLRRFFIAGSSQHPGAVNVNSTRTGENISCGFWYFFPFHIRILFRSGLETREINVSTQITTFLWDSRDREFYLLAGMRAKHFPKPGTLSEIFQPRAKQTPAHYSQFHKTKRRFFKRANKYFHTRYRSINIYEFHNILSTGWLRVFANTGNEERII